MKTKKILFTKSKRLKTFCCFWCIKVWKRDVWKINHLQIRIQRSRNLTFSDWEKLQPSNLWQQEIKSWFIQALHNDVNSRLAGVLVLLKAQNTRQKFHHFIVNNLNVSPLHCEQRWTFHQFIGNNVKHFTTSLWTTSNASPFLVNNIKRFINSLWTMPNISPLPCEQRQTFHHFLVNNIKRFTTSLWTTPNTLRLPCEQRQTFRHFLVNNAKRFTTSLSTASNVKPLHCEKR